MMMLAEISMSVLLSLCTLLNDGMTALRMNEDAKAVRLLTQVIEEPKAPPFFVDNARFWRGIAHLQAGREVEARRDFSPVLKGMPSTVTDGRGSTIQVSRFQFDAYKAAGGSLRALRVAMDRSPRVLIDAMRLGADGRQSELLTPACIEMIEARLADVDFVHALHVLGRAQRTGMEGDEINSVWHYECDDATITFKMVFQDDRWRVDSFTYEITAWHQRHQKDPENLRRLVTASRAWRVVMETPDTVPADPRAALLEHLDHEQALQWLPSGKDAQPLELLILEPLVADLPAAERPVIVAPMLCDGYLVVGFADGHSEFLATPAASKGWTTYVQRLEAKQRPHYDRLFARLRDGVPHDREAAKAELLAADHWARSHIRRYVDDADSEVRLAAVELLKAIPVGIDAINDASRRAPTMYALPPPPAVEKHAVDDSRRERLLDQLDPALRSEQVPLRRLIAGIALWQMGDEATATRVFTRMLLEPQNPMYLESWARFLLATLHARRDDPDAVLATVLPAIREPAGIPPAFLTQYRALASRHGVTTVMAMSADAVVEAIQGWLKAGNVNAALAFWLEAARPAGRALLAGKIDVGTSAILLPVGTQTAIYAWPSGINGNSLVLSLLLVDNRWQVADAREVPRRTFETARYGKPGNLLGNHARCYRMLRTDGFAPDEVFASHSRELLLGMPRIERRSSRLTVRFFPGAVLDDPAGRERVVFASDPARLDSRLVITADGCVRIMDEAEYQRRVADATAVPAAAEPVPVP